MVSSKRNRISHQPSKTNTTQNMFDMSTTVVSRPVSGAKHPNLFKNSFKLSMSSASNINKQFIFNISVMGDTKNDNAKFISYLCQVSLTAVQ